MAWLSGWSYRKEITITGQSGAGTNFQVDLDIGDSAGGDFHLEGHCTNFPQDIEVTDNDGTTLLKFWIADITADPLEMSVKVADDLGSNQTIYIYYGKSGATTNSNGADTFIAYHGTATAAYLDSLLITPSNIIFECLATISASDRDNRYGMSNNADFATDDSICTGPYRQGATNTLYAPLTWDEGSATYDTTTLSISGETRFKLTLLSGTLRSYVDGTERGAAISSGIADETMGLGIQKAQAWADPNQTWAFVRKGNSPEPAFSSAGSEETPSVTVKPMWYYQMLRRRN